MDWNAYLDAWNRHDGEAVASFFTEDGVYADHTLGARAEGREAIEAFVKDVEETASSDFKIEILDSFEAGDRYAAVGTFGGTHDRASSSPPMQATGKQFSVRFVSIGRLEGGKIKENTDYWNLAEMLTQIGLMPAPAGASS
ncbi:MAG: SgcJ/EcaC family oxidoreductase [Candidatus Dormibacteraeota bacterium]|nr:SgcJ/EcaC family oxidoreductase [Candidatus Dormibacteraeota bacterium]MBO0762843.1 SgcJ/EcaC family oxidoreductase [Candidatus Dormibacteraeota bacterium]